MVNVILNGITSTLTNTGNTETDLTGWDLDLFGQSRIFH